MITYFVGIDHFRYPSLFQKYILKVYIIKHQSEKYQHVNLVNFLHVIAYKEKHINVWRQIKYEVIHSK